MGRKLRIGLIALGFVLLCSLTLFLLFPRDIDPSYNGKHLSAWLKDFNTSKGQSDAAPMALAHFGKDATPLLIRMLNQRDSDLRLKLRLWLSQQKIMKLNVAYEPAQFAQARAMLGCCFYGQSANGAVPALVRLVDDFPTRMTNITTARMALGVLAGMGPEGIAGVCHGLTNQHTMIQITAIQLLATASSSIPPQAIKTLEMYVKSSDPSLSGASSQTLALIKRHAERQHPPSAETWTTNAVASASPANVWQYSQGLKIVATTGLYSGFKAEDIFGGHLGTMETAAAIFQDSSPDGAIHTIEWETPAPVTVASFGLLAAHSEYFASFERAFRSFKLYAWNDERSAFTLVYQEDIPVPYGGGFCSKILFLFRNLDSPVVARRFRAEFEQNGGFGSFGPRVSQLFGFPDRLNRPMVENAFQNQNPLLQFEAPRVLDELSGKGGPTGRASAARILAK